MAIKTKKVEHNSGISWIVYVKDEDCMPFSDIHAAKKICRRDCRNRQES